MATRDQALAWVAKLYDVLQGRQKDIKKSFEYFEGKQPLTYASEQWRNFHEDRYKGFADNWCGVVGQAPVDRLRIDGFRIGDDGETPEERALWDDWKRNELGNQSKQGFLASTIAKRSATIVWGSDDEPEVSWEHPAQVVVAYSEGGLRRRLAALKSWREDDKEFVTLYLPDEVWKFQRSSYRTTSQDGRTDSGLYIPGSFGGGGWEPRQPPSDDVWPIPNPLGEVPVVEWLNRPLLGAEPLSDIAGTMAMQDAMNLLWAYLFTAADHAAMSARVVLGAEPPKIPILDENGQIVGSKPAKIEDLAQGRLLFLPGAGSNARIDQWDAAKLDVFTGVMGEALAHIAAQTRTPGHYLLTNDKMANLNGDALTAAEVPLGQKSETAAEFYSPSARETLRLMAKVRGNEALAESLRLAELQWKDHYMHSLAQVADAATKDRAVGMSLRTVLERRYGMTKSEIDREFDRIRAEQADPFTLLDPVTQAAIKGAAGGDTDSGAGA